MDLNYLLPGLEDFVMETNNVHIENNINIPTEDEKINEEIKKQAEEAGLEEGEPEVTEQTALYALEPYSSVWLECYTVTVEVEGPNPFGSAITTLV